MGNIANTIINYLENSSVAPSFNVLQMSPSFCFVGTSLMCIKGSALSGCTQALVNSVAAFWKVKAFNRHSAGDLCGPNPQLISYWGNLGVDEVNPGPG